MFEEHMYEFGYEWKHRKYVKLHGYLQSRVFFKEAFADIRQIFTFNQNISTKIRTFYDKTTALNADKKATFVGVHVRRGDLNSQYLHDFGFATGNETFIARAMEYYIARFETIVFIICSDDLAWCKEKISLPTDRNKVPLRVLYCDSSNDPMVDLGILAACNHSIINGGTFGWWSAFLAGGETIYYKGYSQPNTTFDRQFSKDRSDYYLPHWIGMD